MVCFSRQAGLEPDNVGVKCYYDEFASFVYDDFINLIDKCRSAKISLLLAHQSAANLSRDTLSRSFKSEIVDNTFSKIFLAVKDETAEWAAKQFGRQMVVKQRVSIGQNLDKDDTGAREMQNVAYSEEREEYLDPADFKLDLGYGYAMVGNEKGKLITGPCRVGYVDEKDLCSDEELLDFLDDAQNNHPKRPRNGSLIDNQIDPGPPFEELSEPTPFESSDVLTDKQFVDTDALEEIKSKAKADEPVEKEKPSEPIPPAPAEPGTEGETDSDEETPVPEMIEEEVLPEPEAIEHEEKKLKVEEKIQDESDLEVSSPEFTMGTETEEQSNVDLSDASAIEDEDW
ncbi:MAG: TraM recognition domain-containing protein [Fibrobacteria bacterium]|nr:TraM recognition domain-containing protein [Fibrobacteria bacterium]